MKATIRGGLMTACAFLLAASLLPAIAGTAADAPSNEPFELRDGDRVVFLGNTFIERAQQYGYVEAMLTARHPDRDVSFRNLGWSGDTVWAESRGLFDEPAKGYARMLEHLRELRPTVVFLGYGGNEAFAGKKGLPAFREQLNKLLDDLQQIDGPVRIVILSPIEQENLGPPLPDPAEFNADVKLYARALREIAAERNHRFFDLAAIVRQARSANEGAFATSDGLHLLPGAYAEVASALAPALLGSEAGWQIAIDRNDGLQDATGIAVDDVEARDEGLQFRATADTLPATVPTANTGRRTLTVRGLSSGRYKLNIDGHAVLDATADEWSRGVTIPSGPDDDQAETLRQAIIEKNEMYFHHWRPQNFTYLFGFRKHEQGQNAPEVDEFLQLVAAKEAVIAQVRVPAAHTYAIVQEDNAQ